MSKSLESFISQMQTITENTTTIITKVDAIDARVSNMAKYIGDTNKDMISRITKLEQHILQPSQKCEPPKSVNTVQYNAAAQQVKPIGTCIRTNKGVSVKENFFGFCKSCGDPITSPSVIGYCTVNKLEPTCYPCQKGGKKNNTYSNIILFNAQAAPTPANVTVSSIVVNCDLCAAPRRYKSAEDYIAKKTHAESLGLAGTMCVSCAKKALEHMNAEKPCDDSSKLREERNADRVAAKEPVYVEVGLTVRDFVNLLLEENYTADAVIALKISDVRTLAKEYEVTIDFDGNEWNKDKDMAYELSYDMAQWRDEEVTTDQEVATQEVSVTTPVNKGF